MNWLRFTILALVVYRLSRMFTKEQGPFGMFAKYRKWLRRETQLDEAADCPLCHSVWFGILFAGANFIWTNSVIFETILLSLALSGVAVIIHQQLTKTK